MGCYTNLIGFFFSAYLGLLLNLQYLGKQCISSYFANCVLKDAAMGFVSIQTVCLVLWVDLYRAWT